MRRASIGNERAERAIEVLIVDDNIDAAEMLAIMLEQHGHHVVVTHDGASALKRASETCPDIVLLDIGLPDINGFEVARRLRAQGFSDTMLVALTGYGGTEDERRVIEAGFDQHLLKPVPSEIVLGILAQVRETRRPPALSSLG